MDKIIVITTNIAPYRLKWCEELSNHYDVAIFYTKDKEKDYNDIFLKHSSDHCKIIKLKTRENDGNDHISFDVLKVLKDNKESFIIFDGYGPKTNLLGLVYCKLFGIKTWTNVDGYPTVRTKQSRIVNLLKRFVISHLCDSFFCGGTAVKEHLISFGAKPERITIHNFSSINDNQIIGKPLTKEEKLKIRDELGIDYKGKIVLGVGRFVPLKRFDDLIKAVLKTNSDCHLYLLGGKASETYIKASENSERIHYIDFVLPEDVDKYYMMSDLFVLPSETDVWGLVINEAMAKGLPVISSDSPVASHDLVKDNGFVFETYNVEQLSEDIDICLSEENNIRMSNNSLRIIKDFTVENSVKLQRPVIDSFFFNKNRK